MSDLKIIRPTRHDCQQALPPTRTYRPRTLARCTCGRWHFVRSFAVPYGYFDWAPVRWYHFRLRRAIRRDESDA